MQRIYGPEVQGKNFVYTVVKKILNKEKVLCSNIEISCPTYNRDLANTTMALLEINSSGIFHCAGPECMSKADWGRKIVSKFLISVIIYEYLSIMQEQHPPICLC